MQPNREDLAQFFSTVSQSLVSAAYSEDTINDLVEILNNFNTALDEVMDDIEKIRPLLSSVERDIQDSVHSHEEKADLDHSHSEYMESSEIKKKFSNNDHTHPKTAPLSHDHPQLQKILLELEQKLEAVDLRSSASVIEIKKQFRDKQPHARDHIIGADRIPVATSKRRGLMSPSHVKRLEAVERSKGVKMMAGSGAVEAGSNIRTLTWVIANPVNGNVPGPRISEKMTVSRVDAFCVGGTSVTFNIEERSAVGSAGTDILSSNLAADTDVESVTTGFNNNSITAGNYLFVAIDSKVGSPTQLSVTLTCTV